MTAQVHVPPSQFGPYIRDYINHALCKNVTNVCFGKQGIVLDVVRVISYGEGRICSMTDHNGVTYDVLYVARLFAPYVGEIVDGVANVVESHGIIVQVGPCNIHIAGFKIPDDIKYRDGQYISDDGLVKIKRDSYLRLRILGLKFDSKKIYGVGSIAEDGLGLL